MNLEELGFTKEELQERVVERAAKIVMSGVQYDEDGEEYESDSRFRRKLEQKMVAQIDDKFAKLYESVVGPKFDTFLDKLRIRHTNYHGQETKPSQTLVEFLVARADAFLNEEVDKNLNPRGSSYSFDPAGSRLAVMVNRQLQESIVECVKNVFQDVHGKVTNALKQAVETSLSTLKLDVKLTEKR